MRFFGRDFALDMVLLTAMLIVAFTADVMTAPVWLARAGGRCVRARAHARHRAELSNAKQPPARE